MNDIGLNAYETISELWNAEIAAKRLIKLIEDIRLGNKVSLDDGPCSSNFN
jgi:hypothetical protein